MGIMGIILEIAGIFSIIGGIGLLTPGSKADSSLGLGMILGGVLLWAIGSTNRVAKKNKQLLEELKIWIQAKK